jgi:hypothetical protein
MSQRSDIKAALVAASAAATGVAVENWAGEEAIFNAAHAWPGISVAYAGAEFGEQEEIGGEQATYERGHVFRIFVYTQNTAHQSGDDHAATILESMETKIAGKIIAGQGQAEIIGEELVHVHMGRYLYVQTWKTPVLESHTT